MSVAGWLNKRTAVVRQDGYSSSSPVFTFQAEIEASYRPNYTALREVLALAKVQPGMTLQDCHAAYVVRTAVQL